ncbi:ATP-binding protein [Microbacterium hominis]|uniref:ATP-binding protein n=1 Tax=Microbacterium hominis TaxID=162426 RepID=A0A0B4CZZ7_9MICO|nr:ATP-binding protein [Microbacterium hominis]KIC59976.1 hypothetical protein RM52_00735 [Microbacterium hominis]
MAVVSDRVFGITVLGRTLEHLGTQMYKRRDVALAELVANAWDAGATEVLISVPLADRYDAATSEVSVTDNGTGMSPDQVDDEYLVIGRNRRAEGQSAPKNRKVMGRKGVGKLAGFGLGRKMNVLTWQENTATSIELDGQKLKAEGGETKTLEIHGTVTDEVAHLPYPSGTRVVMTALKHKTPPDIEGLHQALARRFSRTVIGEMRIVINGAELQQPKIELSMRDPSSGERTDDLGDGNKVTWWAGFSKTVLSSELQGFTVLVNGKTAQAPPYFFGVEATASGQHGTKYLTGVIEADFLDDGVDDESDRISTDRQEIDWEDDSTRAFKIWGEALTRRLLRERASARGKAAEKRVLDNEGLANRLARLDPPSREKAKKFIQSLGSSETEEEKILPLADTIIQAFEYQQFHDYISELDAASDDPVQFAKAVSYMHGWRMLESRALLEVIKGRTEIVEKFFGMIVNNAAETAHTAGQDNLHDLVARYPWLLDPDWQVLAEEKTMTKQLREWGAADGRDRDDTRYDFLALQGDGQTVVIEIKRSAHAATLEDLHQLETYVNKLGMGKSNVTGAFITGEHYAMLDSTLESWKRRNDIQLLTWQQIHARTAKHYENYKAILEGDLDADGFSQRAKEVAMTREVLKKATAYRTRAERREGLGPQDNRFDQLEAHSAETIEPAPPVE